MNHRFLVILFGSLILLVAVSGFLHFQAEAAPAITWTPNSVHEVIGQGQSKTISVSFTASQNLTNVTVRVVPELQQVIQTSPTSFATVNKGQKLTLGLTIAASSTFAVGTLDGTIQLRQGGTVATPLPITIEIWPTSNIGELSINYPPRLNLNVKLLSLGGPINLNTFGSAYNQGGIIPEGGAEISISTKTLATSSLDGEIIRDSVDTTVQATSAVVLGGVIGTRIDYLIPFGSLLTYANVIVYLPRATVLYKFSLLYRMGDPREAEFLAMFDDILTTARFAP